MAMDDYLLKDIGISRPEIYGPMNLSPECRPGSSNGPGWRLFHFQWSYFILNRYLDSGASKLVVYELDELMGTS